MVATIIDGKAIATTIQNELKEEIELLKTEHNIIPGLAVILVGNRSDSATYVKMKKKVAIGIGIYSIDINLPDTCTEHDLIHEIHTLNNNTNIHGILVQLPLPNHINESNVLKQIHVTKDVDGFSALNIGNLCLKNGEPPLAIPCTPAGCIELLQRYNITISGMDCIVLGRSNIVGMPLAALLQSCNGTVTVCHSRTKDIPSKLKQADIIVAAIGQPQYVRGEWIKPGCVVIDVGINSIEQEQVVEEEDGTTTIVKKKKYKLVGDVNYDECKEIASAITPVPGGVGPMTIAMLMKNTVNLARHSIGLPRLPLRNKLHRE